MDETPLTEEERDQVTRLLSAPIFFPRQFREWLPDFVANNIPLIPYTHFFGAKTNLARSGDYIQTDETQSSATYDDLATEGPIVSGLANGTYLVLFGCRMNGEGSFASIAVNGVMPTDDDDSVSQSQSDMPTGRGVFVTLDGDNDNSVKMVYRREGGAAPHFFDRWLVLIRIGSA